MNALPLRELAKRVAQICSHSVVNPFAENPSSLYHSTIFLVTLENLALRNSGTEAVKQEMCLILNPDKV